MNNIPWLIDFADTGWSDSLRDFTSLETSIKFDLVTKNSLFSRYEYEKNLNFPCRYGDLILREPDIVEDPSELKKMYHIVNDLRTLAYYWEREWSMKRYYASLFFTTLRAMSFSNEPIDTYAMTFLSAGIILKKLVNWPSDIAI